jgi:hypothetical protein
MPGKKRSPNRGAATLAEILSESARLKRQSSELLKRAAELDEQVAKSLTVQPQPRWKKK